MELSNIQRLAVADAFVKACKDAQKQIRDEVDEETIKLYAESDVTQRAVQLNGQKVGTLSVTMTKPVNGSFPMIDKADEFAEWLRTSDGGLDTIKRLIAVKPDLMLEAATVDGELPDGCVMVDRYEPAHIKGTTLRVQKQKVFDALGAQLGEGIRGILGGE